MPTSPASPAGSYKLNADMLNEAGEKKDSKSVTLTVATGAAPTAPGEANDTHESTEE